MKAYQRVIRELRAHGPQDEVIPTDVDIQYAECREITYKTAETIILPYEWLGTMGTTQLHYGIYFNGVLGGVVCFGYFQAMSTSHKGHPYAYYIGEGYAGKGIQLSRGACVWWAHEHSGSRLIGFALRELSRRGYKYVVAFADPAAGEVGTLYQATNWHYIGTSEASTIHYDVYYRDGRLFYNDRDFFKKYGFCGKAQLDVFISKHPALEVRPRLPKSRYIRLTGNKRENKEMWAHLHRHVRPYPKRDEGTVMPYESLAHNGNHPERTRQPVLL